MASLLDLYQGRGEQPRSQLFEGTVAKTATTLSTAVEVRLPGFDGGRARWPVEGWTPRDTQLPARGDRCLVALSDKGRMWMLCWMPQ